jgi:D-threo-aldose 1-dehydrogenase
MHPVEQYRILGTSGLAVPPMAFSAAPLANACRVIPEQRRIAICVEWFKHVAPPVLIEVTDRYDSDAALGIVSQVMRSADVRSEEVLVCRRLPLNAAQSVDRAALREEIDKITRAGFAPPLVSLDTANQSVGTGAPIDAQSRNVIARLECLSTLRSQGTIRGVGLSAAQWRIGAAFSADFAVDWITLVGEPNLVHHPAELLDWMNLLAARGIAVIVSSVLQGGFLVGGSQFRGRPLNPHDQGDARLLAWRKSLAAICHGHGVSAVAACVQFALAAPSVAAVVVNTSRPERVGELAAAAKSAVPDNFWISLKEEGLVAADFIVDA